MVGLAEHAWNSCNAPKVATASTLDTAWRIHALFVTHRDWAEAFLSGKWVRSYGNEHWELAEDGLIHSR